jgi:hypothetical protein
MVRRGSTVRVRQRALQKSSTSPLLRSARLAGSAACGGYGAVYGAFAFRTASRGSRVEPSGIVALATTASPRSPCRRTPRPPLQSGSEISGRTVALGAVAAAPSEWWLPPHAVSEAVSVSEARTRSERMGVDDRIARLRHHGARRSEDQRVGSHSIRPAATTEAGPSRGGRRRGRRGTRPRSRAPPGPRGAEANRCSRASSITSFLGVERGGGAPRLPNFTG